MFELLRAEDPFIGTNSDPRQKPPDLSRDRTRDLLHSKRALYHCATPSWACICINFLFQRPVLCDILISIDARSRIKPKLNEESDEQKLVVGLERETQDEDLSVLVMNFHSRWPVSRIVSPKRRAEPKQKGTRQPVLIEKI